MSQREARLSRTIMAALREHGAFCFKVHGGPLMMAGLPDIVGVYRGRFFGVETKNPDGSKPTAIQLHRHDQMRQAGAIVVVAHTVAEALVVLNPPRRTPRTR
jgi:Holliday junction resolvase